jgi:hypothetical protein
MRAAIDRWTAELPPPVTPIPLSEYQAHINRLLKDCEITVEWRQSLAMPRGAAAYAHVHRRHIVCPPIESETDVAIALHEIGHCMAEDCRGGLHRRDRAVKEYWHCVRCEVLAWTIAGILVRPLRWSHTMHQRLTQSLEHYRRTTPAGDEALRQLDRLTADLSRLVFAQKAVEAGMKKPAVRELRTPEQNSAKGSVASWAG